MCEMKPVIIIAIAVVCSVIVVLGILIGFVGVSNIEAEKQNEKLREYYGDLDLAESYRIEYDEIAWNSCMKSPPPTTEDERVQSLEESEIKLQYSERMQSTMISLIVQMVLLQEKYPDNDYFEFDETTCPYDEEWIKSIEVFEKNTERIIKFVANQYEKCIDENQSEVICDSKLDEFEELAKLVYGRN